MKLQKIAFQDLHRTGCSLFCGEDAEANQLMLKRVLLAYARWNKSIGYCQGFNMLAALILEVMDKQESESLQVKGHFDILHTASVESVHLRSFLRML